jgi:hypothetical protein
MPDPPTSLRLQLDPARQPTTVQVGETAWLEIEASSPSQFEAMLKAETSDPALLAITDERRVWLPASGLQVRLSIELLALEAREERVETRISLTAGRLIQLVTWSLEIVP